MKPVTNVKSCSHLNEAIWLIYISSQMASIVGYMAYCTLSGNLTHTAHCSMTRHAILYSYKSVNINLWYPSWATAGHHGKLESSDTTFTMELHLMHSVRCKVRSVILFLCGEGVVDSGYMNISMHLEEVLPFTL